MMVDRARILVVAATARELALPDGWLTVRCGVGPVEAAAATAAAIALLRPAAILHVGIAGSRRVPPLEPPAMVIGSGAIYCDIVEEFPWAPRTVAASPLLVEAAQRVLPAAVTLAIGTSAQIGGTRDVDVEAMEGFGVLRAAQVANVPAIEIRAISNEIAEPDRARWRFDEAFAAIAAATPRLVTEFARCVN
jgi:nucleoside phosphorylase